MICSPGLMLVRASTIKPMTMMIGMAIAKKSAIHWWELRSFAKARRSASRARGEAGRGSGMGVKIGRGLRGRQSLQRGPLLAAALLVAGCTTPMYEGRRVTGVDWAAADINGVPVTGT